MDVQPWIKQNCILTYVAGSHSYGLATPESDIDVRGITIPPVEYWIGMTRFEQYEKHTGEDDEVIYSIKKFFQLATDCNPNIIEFLYCDESDILNATETYYKIRDNRDLFLSKKSKFTFSGYAYSQLERIKRHRGWLLDPPTHAPTREEYGLPLNRKISPTILGATETLTKDGYEFSRELMSLFSREKTYQNAKKEWKSYQNWLKNRNLSRMKLEADYGYDTKHASHLARLMLMSVEILRDHEVIVKRPDREFLMGIKNGSMTYNELMEWTTKQEKLANELYETSTLQKRPQQKAIEALLIDIITKFLKDGKI